MTVYIIYFMYR